MFAFKICLSGFVVYCFFPMEVLSPNLSSIFFFFVTSFFLAVGEAHLQITD